VFEAARGAGCQSRWLSVGPLAWVCQDVVELSPLHPLSAKFQATVPANGLPYSYYFVGENGSLGYRDLLTAESGYPDAELEPGFAVAIVDERALVPNDPFGLSTHDLWIPLRDLRQVAPSLFKGVEQPTAQTAWLRRERASVYAAPGQRKLSTSYPNKTQVTLADTRRVHGKVWWQIGDQEWVMDKDLAYQTPAEPPSGLKPHERWIDVDLEHQVLTAYQGAVPVFSTLVSSGRGTGTAEDATPVGEHRLWVKLLKSDMDNLESAVASRYYAIQSVPWVMYFKDGYGLHGAFWHDDFGQVRSHGCVNLTPVDAQRLFFWSSPHLPAGWTAVFPTVYDRGTLVRIR
jgi:lipoprotein-anchoring transpeptidase ErfK/SrfK